MTICSSSVLYKKAHSTTEVKGPIWEGLLKTDDDNCSKLNGISAVNTIFSNPKDKSEVGKEQKA